MDPPTIPFYKQMHKIACAHFEDKITHTQFNAKEVDTFRTPRRVRICVRDFFLQSMPQNKEILDALVNNAAAIPWFEEVCKNKEFYYKKFGGKDNFLKRRDCDQKRYENEILPGADKAIDEMNKYLKEQHVAHFVRFERYGDLIYIKYGSALTQIVSDVEKAFKAFDTEIARAKTSDDKIIAIARLFQIVEWRHPFPDGQTRTDFILLNKLLCQHGFNPAILKYPFASSFSTLEGWVDYLKEGMEKWQVAFARVQSEKD
jgi:hypothetical protein